MNNRRRGIIKIVRRWGGCTFVPVYVRLNSTTLIKMWQLIGVPTFNKEEIPQCVAPKPQFVDPWNEFRKQQQLLDTLITGIPANGIKS